MKNLHLIALLAALLPSLGSAETSVRDAADFGFSTNATGIQNQQALQKAVDGGGAIRVSAPGIYPISGTVYLDSHTTLTFEKGTSLKKVKEKGGFIHVLLNRGALTKTWNEDIRVDGLRVIVNGVDGGPWQIFGLRGQIAFFYVKNLSIRGFRCEDLGSMQFGVHVCTFEDVFIEDTKIKGQKDGIHLGRGTRFTIRDGVFETGDDAVALNAHDYATSNPEMGWIENGIVENCHDLNSEKPIGYFCRILAGAWTNWYAGMEVQNSDSVVSEGRVYRFSGNPDDTVWISSNAPTHETGTKIVDGIKWVMVQNEAVYSAGVRNVAFRNIFLSKPRVAFSVHFDVGKYSRSYYPGSVIPVQEQLTFDNIRILYDKPMDFLAIATPIDSITVTSSSLRNNVIRFNSNKAMKDYLPTTISLIGCGFRRKGPMDLVVNGVPGKSIYLKTFGSVELGEGFSARVVPGGGTIEVDSDLTGLKK